MTTPPTTPGERLLRARLMAGHRSARDFCQFADIAHSSYSACESDKRPLTSKAAAQYAAALGVTSDYLLSGKDDAVFMAYGKKPESGQLQYVPALGVSDLAALEAILQRQPLPAMFTEPLPRKIKAGPHAFAVDVADDAMSPQLAKESIAYFDPDAPLIDGAIVMALVPGIPFGVIRRYSARVDGFALVPANGAAVRFESFSQSQGARIVAVMIGHWSAS